MNGADADFMDAVLEALEEKMSASLPPEGDALPEESQPTLKQRLEKIDKDIEKLWPPFRDSDHLDHLTDLITYPNDELLDEALEDEEFEDYFAEYASVDYFDKKFLALNDYTKCLRYMDYYTLSTKELDLPSLSKIFDEQARSILSVIHDVLKTLLSKNGSRHIGPWAASFLGYARAAMEFADTHSDEEDIDIEDIDIDLDENTQSLVLMIQSLTFSTRFVEMSITGLLLSDTPAARADGVRVHRLLKTTGEYADGEEMGSEHFYGSTNRRWLLTKFQAATAQFVDVEWQHEIIDEFLYHITPFAPETLFQKVLSLSVTILQRKDLAGTWAEKAEPNVTDYIDQPNKIYMSFLERKFPGDSLGPILAIIEDHEAAELMCSRAIDSASNFMPSKAILNMKTHKELSSLTIGHELFLVPILTSILHPVKNWTEAHEHLALRLADKLKPLWKETLTTLRALLTGNHVTKRSRCVVPWVIDEWRRLGSLIGLHELLDEPYIGCFSQKCPFFMKDRGRDMPRCQCRRAQYCDAECQKADWNWKAHKPHCGISTKKL